MSPTEIALIVLITLAVLAAVPVIWVGSRRRALRTRFGPEYERLVEERRSRAAADRDRWQRDRRHEVTAPVRPAAPQDVTSR